MTTIRDIFPGASQPQTLTCGLTDILREDASLLRGADVHKLAASQTRWYTSEHQYEDLTGHVYDFYPGDKYEDDDNYLTPVYLAVITSNDTDIVCIDSDLYPAQADALSRAETMAQWLAEHEYAFNYHRDHGAQARHLLCESHHVRREAVRLTRLAYTFAAQGMRSDADRLAHKELLADAARVRERNPPAQTPARLHRGTPHRPRPSRRRLARRVDECALSRIPATPPPRSFSPSPRSPQCPTPPIASTAAQKPPSLVAESASSASRRREADTAATASGPTHTKVGCTPEELVAELDEVVHAVKESRREYEDRKRARANRRTQATDTTSIP